MYFHIPPPFFIIFGRTGLNYKEETHAYLIGISSENLICDTFLYAV